MTAGQGTGDRGQGTSGQGNRRQGTRDKGQGTPAVHARETGSTCLAVRGKHKTVPVNLNVALLLIALSTFASIAWNVVPRCW